MTAEWFEDRCGCCASSRSWMTLPGGRSRPQRVGSLLGLRLRAASPTAIELVGPVDAATRDRLAAWLDDQDSTT